jgi:triosephosphate isomerase
MREKIVAGNWKMNTTLEDGVKLAKEVSNLVKDKAAGDVRVIIAPPFVHLTEIVKAVDTSRVQVSAQNAATEPKGAFTGEVAPAMIKSTGAEYTILGHSERRSYYNEDDGILERKVNLALEEGLKPIFCIGEVLEEREAEKQAEVVSRQLENVVFKLSEEDFRKIIIAYEPVWAIGTGKTATPEQAQEMHAYIRKLIADKYNQQVADDTTILYGGSCKPSNAEELFANPDVDGGLIGGASLKANDFVAIINSY